MTCVFGFGHVVRGAVLAAAAALALGAAQAQETVKIGFIGPMSGGDAQQGLSARNGFQIAVDQANKSGLPFKIEPVVLDDAANPQTGVSAALKLTNDPDVAAATGHWNSGVALATIPIFTRANVPIVIWGAISPKITATNNPWVSRVVPTLVNTNAPLADWAAKNIGKRIAIVTDTTDYGMANLQDLRALLQGGGRPDRRHGECAGRHHRLPAAANEVQGPRTRRDLFRWRCDRSRPGAPPDGRARPQAADDWRRRLL